MIRTNPDDLIDLFRLARIQQRRYALEQFEASILRDIQATVNTARKQIVKDLETRIRSTSEWSRGRANEVLQELDDLSLGLRQTLGQSLTTASAHVGSTGMQDAYETLSVNGLGSMVNNVALSPGQFQQFLTVNPIQGLLIPQWVDRAYTAGVRDQLQEEILTQLRVGALRGEGYAKIVRRLEDGFSQFSKRELTTLTRTFMQDANVRAHQAVMEANRDVIEGWIWTVAADDRTCILCLPLSETFYGKDEEHPPMIRHPRCRCFPRTKTVSYRSLGIDIDELEPIEKAIVTRGYEDEMGRWVIPPVDVGGAKIQSIRFHRDGLKGAFQDMPAKQQAAMIGPKRLELLKSGKISMDDLVDKRTGRLVLLDDLRAGKLPGGGGFVPAKTIAEAQEYASMNLTGWTDKKGVFNPGELNWSDPSKRNFYTVDVSLMNELNSHLTVRMGQLKAVPAINPITKKRYFESGRLSSIEFEDLGQNSLAEAKRANLYINARRGALKDWIDIWDVEVENAKKTGIPWTTTTYMERGRAFRTTIDHELGHIVLSAHEESGNKNIVSRIKAAMKRDGTKIPSQYAKENDHELFAELFSLFLGNKRILSAGVIDIMEEITGIK